MNLKNTAPAPAGAVLFLGQDTGEVKTLDHFLRAHLVSFGRNCSKLLVHPSEPVAGLFVERPHRYSERKFWEFPFSKVYKKFPKLSIVAFGVPQNSLDVFSAGTIDPILAGQGHDLIKTYCSEHHPNLNTDWDAFDDNRIQEGIEDCQSVIEEEPGPYGCDVGAPSGEGLSEQSPDSVEEQIEISGTAVKSPIVGTAYLAPDISCLVSI